MSKSSSGRYQPHPRDLGRHTRCREALFFLERINSNSQTPTENDKRIWNGDKEILLVKIDKTRSKRRPLIGANATNNCQIQLEAGTACHILCTNRAATNLLLRSRVAAQSDWFLRLKCAGVLPTTDSAMRAMGPEKIVPHVLKSWVTNHQIFAKLVTSNYAKADKIVLRDWLIAR